MSTYCLDTNTCIDWLKGNSRSLRERLSRSSPGAVAIPSMVEAELLLGAELSSRPQVERLGVSQLLRHLPVLSFDSDAAKYYARIRAELQRKGTPVGANDLVIAATALSHRATLVTHNTREFSRIPGLTLEDWTKP